AAGLPARNIFCHEAAKHTKKKISWFSSWVLRVFVSSWLHLEFFAAFSGRTRPSRSVRSRARGISPRAISLCWLAAVACLVAAPLVVFLLSSWSPLCFQLRGFAAGYLF